LTAPVPANTCEIDVAEFDVKKAEELERKYDSGLQTRAIGPWLLKFTSVF
jgi:hypothetical protein